MTIKNLLNPAVGMNTGKIEGSLEPGLVVSGMLVPYDWTVAIAASDSSATILAAIETALSAALLNDTYASRAHYIGPFEGFDDKGEATTYQTLGYGRKVETQRAIITKEYQILEGGIQYWKAVQSFKGKEDQYKWIEFDNQGVVYGTDAISTTTGLVTGIQGFRLSSISPQDRKQANKGSVEMRMFNITFADSGEANEGLYAIETGIDIDSYVKDLGVQDVRIVATGAMVAKVVTCSIRSGDGAINLCETNPSLIVAASFLFTNLETASTTITLTSVTIVGGNAVFTFAGTGAGWVPGNHVQISFKPVSTLATAGFKYYEVLGANIASVVMVA